MKKYYLLLSLLLLALPGIRAEAQVLPRYFIYFKDKANSTFSVQNPDAFLSQRAIARRQRQGIAITTSDLPVNSTYIQAVQQTGAKVFFTSRWFNAALLEATDAQWAAIKALPFYKSTERNLPIAPASTPGVARLGAVHDKFGAQETIDYGQTQGQLAMLGIPAIHEKGFHGEGMLVAVLDAGFPKANEVGYLKPVFDSKRMLDTYDFISRKTGVYDNHPHGLNCLSIIGAEQPGLMVGAAYKASFALYRTENDFSETPYEEATWIMAAERADSLGVDIISSSLGYNLFDNPVYDYTTQQLDGRTALISKAALYAARRGILVVNSAGNSGNDPWKLVTPPADADSILAIGATFSNRSYAPFSSIGPTTDGRIKPDVSAQGVGTTIGNSTGGATSGSGTSFSAPLIAGMAALLWQEFPYLTAQQLIKVIKQAGDKAANPDNLLGYGIPTIQKAEELVRQTYAPLATEPGELVSVELYPNPTREEVYLRFGNNQVPGATDAQILSTAGVSLTTAMPVTQANVRLPVGMLPAGLYFVKITTPQGVRVLKFLKY
ncbi:S8 family serine peptidase [Persicitalea jodogahamensis]|uniref:Serine protease n=1 Tax=Persicitalea jodogahamensis TaxID=402147 RepID=A0A8J3D2N2_9BACT|nr:S8 family serine peptidase [Persicitalea jodogahamensis]GHB60044.1 serine protease [Persicitalea jodogahamensis]